MTTFNQRAFFSAAAMLALCGTALGQNALGDGRALDANLSTTGRANQPARSASEQMRFNNAIITGSAPGGKAFRGSLGYRATDQFGGSTGSDTLYNFRRDSSMGALPSTSMRASDALRYQFALTTGQYVPENLSLGFSSVQREGSVTTQAAGSSGPSPLRSTADFIAAQGYRASTVGIRHDEFGAEYTARASPLLGIMWLKTGESPMTQAPAPGSAQPTIPTPEGVTPVPGTTPPGTLPQPVTPLGVPAPVAPADKPVTPVAPGAEGIASPSVNAVDRSATALDTRVQGLGLRQDSVAYTQIRGRFQSGLELPSSKPTTDPTKPETMQEKAEHASIDAQLDRLHKMLRGEPLTEPRKGDAAKPKPKDDVEAEPAKPLVNPGLVDTSADASSAKPVAPKIMTTQELLSPTLVNGLKKVGEKKVERLVEPGPRPDGTPGDEQGYKKQMREGEDFLGKGRFFDAEERFVRAMAAMPGDPMALVGRMHSQIGAGLYLSAAANLRMLIAQHPEMAATRYETNLLPGRDRAKVVVEQLLEQEKKAESALGRESALLVAYMGYQQGLSALVEQGLSDFSKRALEGDAGKADRALLELLKAVWVTKSGGTSPK